MKAERKIMVAFLLNSGFAVFELLGAFFTGSVAILSDAMHDAGDALSIGMSYFLQRKSKNSADNIFTYGYGRYSVLGAALTDAVLIIGSVIVIYRSALRLIAPAELNAQGMLIFAVIGFAVNLIAALVTRDGASLNQRAVNLHMLEDVLGWAVVLIGSVVIKLTQLYIIDPIMSIGVAIFILVHALKGFGEIMNLFLEKIPSGTDLVQIKNHLLEIEGVADIHHIHFRSLDGENNLISLHAVVEGNPACAKKAIKERLRNLGISHATVETEAVGERCEERECVIEEKRCNSHHGHHH